MLNLVGFSVRMFTPKIYDDLLLSSAVPFTLSLLAAVSISRRSASRCVGPLAFP